MNKLMMSMDIFLIWLFLGNAFCAFIGEHLEVRLLNLAATICCFVTLSQTIQSLGL